MPVEIVSLDEVPQEVAKGFSAYRRMSEWPEVLSLLPRLKVADSIRIELSKESARMVQCPKPSQHFAAQLRRHFKREALPYKAWARSGMVFVAHADRNGMAPLPRANGKFAKPADRSQGPGAKATKPRRGIQSYTAGPSAATEGMRVCENCGKPFEPPALMKPPWYCSKPDCRLEKHRRMAREQWQNKHSLKAKGQSRQKPSRAQKPRAPALASNPPDGSEPQSFPHVELPPDSEHGQGFQASELREMQPPEAMIHYARRHGGRFIPDEAAAFFALAGVFGISNEAAVENKLLQLISKGAAKKYFEAAGRGVFALRKRGVAA